MLPFLTLRTNVSGRNDGGERKISHQKLSVISKADTEANLSATKTKRADRLTARAIISGLH